MTDFSHPSLDEVADLHEGVLSDQRSAELLNHVGACEVCSAGMAALDEVQAMLAADAVPAMPSAVADSLDAALRRAGAERAGGVPSLAERREADERGAARRSRWLRAVGAAAAVVVVGYGAVVALEHLPEGGSSDSASSVGREPAGVTAAGGAGIGAYSEDVPQVGPRTLPQFARSLAVDHGAKQSTAPSTAPLDTVRVPTLSQGDAALMGCTPDLPRGHATVVVAVWKGSPATIAVYPKTHHVRVYDCGEPLTRLYSASY